MNGRHTLATASLAFALALGACGPKPLTPRERRTLEAYLTCIECDAPLEMVLSLARRKREATVDSLNAALRNGPVAHDRAGADSALARGFIRDSAWRSQTGRDPGPSRDLYVTEGWARYANGYRVHGALGLGFIHDARAIQYLNDALALPLPPSVRSAVLYARDSLPPP